MRKLFTFLLPAVLLSGFTASAKPKIVFEETSFEIKDNVLGQTSDHIFVFKNEGDAPLVVADAVPSCGCVTPTWTKRPVAPGDTGFVHVYYQSKVSGTFHKSIKVYSNSSGKRPVLQISGVTEKK